MPPGTALFVLSSRVLKTSNPVDPNLNRTISLIDMKHDFIAASYQYELTLLHSHTDRLSLRREVSLRKKDRGASMAWQEIKPLMGA